MSFSGFISITFPSEGCSFCFKKSGNLTFPMKHNPCESFFSAVHNREKVEAYLLDWLEYGRQAREEQERNPPPVVVRLRALKAERQKAALSTS